MKHLSGLLKNKIFMLYFKGVTLCSCIIGTPLFLHQFPHVRSGFFWYPVFLLIFIAATSLLLTLVSGRAFQQDDPPFFQRILLTLACSSAGFFPVWLATFGPEVLGRNAWRGNVVSVNIIMGFLGLTGGIWASLGQRWFQQKPFSCKRTALITTGAWGLYFFTGIISRVQGSASFSAMFKVFTQGVHDDYLFYFFWEALVWRIIWPFGFISVLTLYVFQEKIFYEDPKDKGFKAKRPSSWWD